MITIFLALVIIVLVTIFSVQNASPVAVTFLHWKFEASLAIVVFLSVLSGIVVASIISFSRGVRKSLKKSSGEQQKKAQGKHDL